MTRHIVFTIALVSLTLLHSCGLTDDRESKSKDYMQQKIADESGNALKLESFSKTNGIERENGKYYTLEWQARVSSQKNVWKDGIQDMGFIFFDDFKVLTKLHEMDMYRDSRPYLKIGTIIDLKGNCGFEKTEKGWRVDDYKVTSYKISGKDTAPAK